jgi:hypothetical protein
MKTMPSSQRGLAWRALSIAGVFGLLCLPTQSAAAEAGKSAPADSQSTASKPAIAAPDDTTSDGYSFGEMSIAGLSLNSLNIYGYFATRLEKNWSVPGLEGAQIVKADEPAEWTNPFFNVMLQHQTSAKFKVFVNLNGAQTGTIEVRNLWGEYSELGKKFYDMVIGKSANQVRRQWTKLLLSGQAAPPLKQPSDKNVKKVVAGNPNAIGYIATSALDDSVREVLRIEKEK